MAITANRGAQTRLIFFILVLTVLLTPGLFADDGCGTKCGYRTVCGEKGCVCTDKDDALFTITKTESALIYCVQNCQSNASSCPDNTTCRVLTAGDEWLGCYCSAEAELSDRGQCQGESQFPKPAKPGSTRSPTTSATREVTWSSITSRISEQVTSTTSITHSTEFSSPTEISTGTQTSTKEHPVAKNTCKLSPR
ncbi:uncharacterized protein LOC135462501 [Liolophura sinensis]|uniref:uncharacterized protein LOC135462501 n=1 Tax=Liolophura sinensis TaxID=3198878 RepID=UPI0031593FF9